MIRSASDSAVLRLLSSVEEPWPRTARCRRQHASRSADRAKSHCRWMSALLASGRRRNAAPPDAQQGCGLQLPRLRPVVVERRDEFEQRKDTRFGKRIAQLRESSSRASTAPQNIASNLWRVHMSSAGKPRPGYPAHVRRRRDWQYGRNLLARLPPNLCTFFRVQLYLLWDTSTSTISTGFAVGCSWTHHAQKRSVT